MLSGLVGRVRQTPPDQEVPLVAEEPQPSVQPSPKGEGADQAGDVSDGGGAPGGRGREAVTGGVASAVEWRPGAARPSVELAPPWAGPLVGGAMVLRGPVSKAPAGRGHGPPLEA